MNLWSYAALVYIAARTVIAGALLVLAARRRAPVVLGAQAVSDAAAVVLLLAYARYDVRAVIAWLAVPCFVYFVAWEVLAAARRFEDMGDTVDDQWSDAELIGGTARWAWDVLGIAPAFVFGVLVAGSVVLPGQWSLPGTPPPLVCVPAEIRSGDTLTLRMKVPHGGELGVFTPRRGYVGLRSTPAAGTVADADRFEYQARLVIPIASVTEVFRDSGAYLFSLSEYKDISTSITCAVRYHP